MPQLQRSKKKQRPSQQQRRQPGMESRMSPSPKAEVREPVGTRRLEGKVALITGGDSGIGRAVALAFAEEGARIAVVYLNETEDAKTTCREIREKGCECVRIAGDVSREAFCVKAVKKTVETFGRIDILVNNAAQQFPQKRLEDISEKQLDKTFRTNIYSQFFMAKAALPHMKAGSVIINTTSVTAYRGSPTLIDYSSTKGAIVSFTRSLAHALVKRKIRVNAVAPGPVWTPLIPATFPNEKVETFGSDVPMGRAGQPNEIAPCFVFLATEDSSYFTGQVLHPNGGEVVNG